MAVVLTLPTIKGSELTIPEMESNLTDLRDAVNLAKYETDITTSASYTVGVKQVILMDATAGVKQVDLPDATLAANLDKVYIIKKTDVTTNLVNVKGFGAQLVNDLNIHSIKTHGHSMTIICNGVGWQSISQQRNSPEVVGTKLTTTTVVNTTTETLLYAYQFPANAFIAGEQVISKTSGSYSNETANDDFTVTVKMNGFAMHSLSRVGTLKTAAGWKLNISGIIRSIGGAGTYIDVAGLSDGDSMFTEASASEIVIDTTIPILYEVYVQWDNAKAGNTFSCTQGTLTLGGNV